MQPICASTLLHAPDWVAEERNNACFLIDRETPHWIATDATGRQIIELVGSKSTVADVIAAYAHQTSTDPTRAWLHCHTLLSDALHRGFLSREPFTQPAFRGRAEHLEPTALRELWLHTNNSCNLTCSHCLVSSGPDGHTGLETDALLSLIDEASELGVERFYITGGEPMIRPDFWQLVDAITERAELAVLTNATLIKGVNAERLGQTDPARLLLQVSLDGHDTATNDPIRGEGSFERTLAGIRNAVELGFQPTLTTVVTAQVADQLEQMVHLAADLGLRAVHLLWLHLKGRARHDRSFGQPIEQLVAAVERARDVGLQLGVAIDNYEELKTRLGGPPGVKLDLSGASWESLCVYADGSVYPSAAMAQEPSLKLGHINESSLRSLWLGAPAARSIRAASVMRVPQCQDCRYRYLCGGGDIEHRYFYADSASQPFEGDDPYCELYQAMIRRSMYELACQGGHDRRPPSGYDAPVIYASMGDVRNHDFQYRASNGTAVGVKHSNCVLSFDLDSYRKPVREFYGEAAEKPQQDLCCPVNYKQDYLSHIPAEVLEVFYGCGGPMQEVDVAPGMTVLDLGSGGGIDCFIAAKRVGPAGKVIGVDMTDSMLERARRNQPLVAETLGYDVVEFRQGYLEKVPAESGSVDLVTSNCVVNLSPDKRRVFGEVWRILRNHGSFTLSDIVTEEPLPLHLATNPQLVGECVGQALTEVQLLAHLEQAGFYGIQILKKFFWREVEGHPIHSITVQGFKFAKGEPSNFIGQQAIYQGPMKAALDEEGHLFPRGEAVAVCTDTAAKLSRSPYNQHFTLLDGDGRISSACCDSVDSACGAPDDSACGDPVDSACCDPVDSACCDPTTTPAS